MRNILAIVALCLSVAPAVAQERPNFSGRWLPLQESEGLAQVRALTIKQDAKTIRLTHDITDIGARTTTYTFVDGTESADQATKPVTSKASWSEKGLPLINVILDQHGKPTAGVTRSIVTLDAEGRLVMENTVSFSPAEEERKAVVIFIKK